MDFLSNLCVGFSWDKLPSYNKEYLYDMYREIKYGQKCPKTFNSMEDQYPNRGNFKFFTNASKLENYITSSPKRNETYVSHLLDGNKYFMVWTCDPIKTPVKS
tara:strand:- start:167 stop:475 length:309 start_codon:yes stop_codon:yes gene_type:complete